MSDIELRLPYPLSVNHYYGHRAVVRKNPKPCKCRGLICNHKVAVVKYLKREVNQYRDAVTEAVFDQLGKLPDLRGRLAVIIRLRRSRTGKADNDNTLKCLLDAMQYARVYKDDEQIDELLIVKGRYVVTPRVEVTIKTID